MNRLLQGNADTNLAETASLTQRGLEIVQLLETK